MQMLKNTWTLDTNENPPKEERERKNKTKPTPIRSCLYILASKKIKKKEIIFLFLIFLKKKSARII